MRTGSQDLLLKVRSWSERVLDTPSGLGSSCFEIPAFSVAVFCRRFLSPFFVSRFFQNCEITVQKAKGYFRIRLPAELNLSRRRLLTHDRHSTTGRKSRLSQASCMLVADSNSSPLNDVADVFFQWWENRWIRWTGEN